MHRLLFREGLALDEARTRIAALAENEPGSAADVALMNDFLAAATRGLLSNCRLVVYCWVYGCQADRSQ